MSPFVEIVASLVGLSTGMFILVRVALGHEVISSHPWRGVELSPLLTRLSSGLFAFTFVAMAALIFPGTPLQELAALLLAAASAGCLGLLVLAAIPGPSSWGRHDLGNAEMPTDQPH